MYITVLKMTRETILNAPKLLNISSGYAVHKWLTARQQCTRQEDKLLFRIIEQQNALFLYIQSLQHFNLNNIEKYGFKFFNEIEIKELDNHIYFDCTVFPNKEIQGRKMFLKDQLDRENWLKNQFNKNGLNILDCTEYKLSNLSVDKEKPKNISVATYRGFAEVLDTEKAINFIQNGLGRLKTFGAGMILVR